MSLPIDRASFKEYCLRKLGKPVVEINVDDDQLDDRVDEALLYFYDYHFDGSDKIYYKYQITTLDITNRYITLPDNIIGAVSIFDISSAVGVNNMFSITYQIALNDLYTLTSQSMVPYYMAMTGIAQLEQLLVGKKPIRYNRHINRLYIDMNWTLLNQGSYVIVEAYQVVDPDLYTKTWSDRWLARYGEALIKQQWGQNLKKFSGVKMPGGIVFNGQDIFDEATLERKELEKEMIYSYSLPATDMIG